MRYSDSEKERARESKRKRERASEREKERERRTQIEKQLAILLANTNLQRLELMRTCKYLQDVFPHLRYLLITRPTPLAAVRSVYKDGEGREKQRNPETHQRVHAQRVLL